MLVLGVIDVAFVVGCSQCTVGATISMVVVTTRGRIVGCIDCIRGCCITDSFMLYGIF